MAENATAPEKMNTEGSQKAGLASPVGANVQSMGNLPVGSASALGKHFLSIDGGCVCVKLIIDMTQHFRCVPNCLLQLFRWRNCWWSLFCLEADSYWGQREPEIEASCQPDGIVDSI